MGATSSSRRAFVRTEVPQGEKTASLVIVALLGVIGIAFFWKGRIYDPSTYQPDPDKLEASNDNSMLPETAPSLAGMTGLIGSADGPVVGGGDLSGVAAEGGTVVDPGIAKLFELGMEDLRPAGAIEAYGPATLFEKINGRAPAYLKYHFKQMTCRTFLLDDSGERFVDLFLYEMGSPADAFGIFSLERDPSSEPAGFVADGYGSGGSYFFRQGSFYVQVLASGEGSEGVAANIAEQIAGLIEGDDSGLEGRSVLPIESQVQGTAEFIPTDAQGLPFLKDVHQATYRVDDVEFRYFVMVAPETDVAAAWDAYKTFCGKYGKVEGELEIGGAKVFTGEIFGSRRVIYAKGDRLGGVFEGSDAGVVLGFVREQLEKGKNPE